MVTAGRRVALAAVAWVALGACSSALSDAEVRKRIGAADAAASDGIPTGDTGSAADGVVTGDGAGAADATPAGPACGDKNTQQNVGEECDDGNEGACDGCHQCKLRKAMKITDYKSFARADAAKFQPKLPLSISAWFRPEEPNAPGTAAFVVLSAGTATDKTLVFGLAVTRHADDTIAATCVVGSPGQDASLLLVDAGTIAKKSWHHLRCSLQQTGQGATAKLELRASLDGAKYVTKSENVLPNFSAALTANKEPAINIGAVFFPIKGLPGAYQGLIDEVHLVSELVTAPESAATEHVADGAKNTIALYHMDQPGPDKVAVDAGKPSVNALQMTFAPGAGATPKIGDADLQFVPDDCRKP